MDSGTGLIIQFAGVFLVTTLFVFLTTSLKSVTLKYWKGAWLSLSFALFCLFLAFNVRELSTFFCALYYLAEYLFVFLLIAGCRHNTSGKKIAGRSWLLFAAGIPVAVFLAFPFTDFNEVFNFHSCIMAVSFAVAFFSLKSSNKFSKDEFGWRVMKFALALLAVDFFHYTIIFSFRNSSYSYLLSSYLAFNSIVDLVLEILLGFGMVIVLLEKVRQAVEETNHKLKEAHDKLEKLAHVDPLTAAFTRHAFYSFLQTHSRDNDAIHGCVGVFDIDNLKPINDRFGHSAGDVAISSVSHAIRSLVRADDLIFRWGGDEFFVIMLGFDTEQAIDRMCQLNSLLENIKLRGLTERASIKVSFGFADFGDIGSLESSIEEADAEMYKAKQQGKCAEKTVTRSFPVSKISTETLAVIH